MAKQGFTATMSRRPGAMRPFLGWARMAYGLDQRGPRVSIVRAVRNGRRVAFVRPPEPRLAKGVEEDSAAGVACLSPRESLTRWLESPLTSIRKSLRVFPTLLDVELPFPVEDCDVAFLDVHRTADGKKTRALAVVATRAAIEGRLAALKKINVDPVVLDQEGLAVWTQMLQEMPLTSAPRNQVRVGLVMEDRHSSLTIGRGNELINCYAVRMEDMARIARLVRAQRTGDESAVEWMLAGSEALDQAKVARVEAMLAGEKLGSSRVVPEPEAFVARALARRALTAGPLRCNLRQGAAAHARVLHHDRRRRAVAAAMMLAAGMLLCGINVAAQWRAGRVRARAAREVAGQVDQLAGYPVAARGRDALAIVANRVEERRAQLHAFTRAFAPSLAELLADILGEAGRLGMKCETIAIDRDRVTIDGIAADWDSVDALADRMRQVGYPVEVDRKESLSNERVAFTVFTRGEP